MTKYSSYILFLLLSVLVVILYGNGFGPLDSAQQAISDTYIRMTAPDVHNRDVVIVAIDDRSTDKYGQWPWSHDLLADLAAAVATGEPKVLVLDMDLSADVQQDSAGYTDILVGQISWIKNVVLPYDFSPATFRSDLTETPKPLFYNSVAVNNPIGIMGDRSSLLARKVFLPSKKLLSVDPALGFVYDSPDEDRVLRRHSLLTHYKGYYYPSQALLAAALYLNTPPDMIKAIEGESVRIGEAREIPTGPGGDFILNFDGENRFTRFSAAAVLSDDFNRSSLSGKLVVITVDLFGRQETFDTPASTDTPSNRVRATAIANILDGNFITDRTNTAMINMLVLFLIGGLCAFLLPRVTLLYRMVILAGGLIVLANVGYLALSSFGIVINVVYLGLEMVLFMAAAPLLDSQLLSGGGETETVSLKTSRRIGSSTRLSHDGHSPDAAPVRHSRTIERAPTEEIEAKTQAVTDYQAIDIDASADKTVALSDSVSTDTAESDAHSDMEELASDPAPATEMDEPSDQEPAAPDSAESSTSDSGPISESQSSQLQAQAADTKNLGRYQVLDVLGKGAMGLVYKGIDPAINRPVALKTIRLDFVNDPDEMEELKERLHREAQAAGRLAHPNIVTIYDVGSEGPLQYIAMEYLEGQTLEDLIKKKTKFNYRIIAQIITQMCAALEYAHEQGIVHRDIKPANVMVMPNYRVKVMDYGIARIDSSSMTKTGIAMGTPNYISPEQLKGLATDRRADLFSLGVVMYEMLLGRRPFKGENITSLIYAILHHEPEKPSDINPQIPLLFDHIIGRALKKEPGERYQRASDITNDLKDFVESFVSR